MLRIYTIENTRYCAPPAGHVHAFLSRDERDAALERIRAQAIAFGLAESAVKSGIVADSIRISDGEADTMSSTINDIHDEPGTIICVR